MAETAALLVDEVLPRQPLRQWVLNVPFPLRFLFATEPAAVTAVLGIVYRAISTHLIRKAGLKQSAAQNGAVTLIQRFGSALNLNIHFHLLVLDGVYIRNNDRLEFRRVPPPTKTDGPRGNWRPGRGRRRGGRLRGSWGLRKGVGRSGPGRVHDAGGSRLRGWRPAGPKAVAAGVPGWQTSAMRVAVFEFPIPKRVLETVSLTADSKSGPY